MKRLIDRRGAIGALVGAGAGAVAGSAFGAEGEAIRQRPWPDEGLDIRYLPRPSESTSLEAIKVPEIPRGYSIVYFTGDVNMTDVNRERFSFSGGVDDRGRNRGSIVVVQSPIGAQFGGKDVFLNLRPKYVSILQVTSPAGDPDLTNNINRLVNFGLDSFRRNGVNSHIDVVVINGATGAITGTHDVFPGQKLPALEGRTFVSLVGSDKK